MRLTLSIIVPTCGRPTLDRALSSATCQLLPGDEIIVVCDDTGDWGHSARNRAMERAAGDFLMFLDDDDVLVATALETVRVAIARNPDKPHVFGMIRVPHRDALPHSHTLEVGNVSTGMFVVPRTRLGTWGPEYEGDFDFIVSTVALHSGSLIWVDEPISVWRPGSLLDSQSRGPS